ncbi:MAG: Ig-like domain-containing protein, partial [Pirellulales bacterium]
MSVSATDVLGNVGTDDTADELVIDTVVPVVSVKNLLTNDSTPALSGLVNDPTAVVLIVVDGQTVSAVNDEVGGWSVAGDVLAALGEGTYDVQATASDAAGNVGSDETTSELEVDLTAPSVAVDALLTNDTTPLLTGAVNDNDAVVTVSVGGQSGQAVNNQNGTWSFGVPAALSEGIYDVSVSAVDPASNSASDSTTNELKIDLTSPVVGVDSLVTNDTTPELTGTVDDSTASISVTVGGQTLSATNNGNGTWVLADGSLSALVEGTYDVVVSAADLAGNIGDDGTTSELEVDLTAPVVGVDPLVTNDTTPGLSGTVDDSGAVVSVVVNGQTVSAINAGDGTWSVADGVLDALSENVYDVSVSAIDAVGNVGSDGTTNELEVDLTAPVVSVDALTTNDTTPSLSGSVDDAAAVVSVTVNGQALAATNNQNGTWLLADDSLSALAEGAYDVSVSAVDLAGNVGQDASGGELLIDVSGPYVVSSIASGVQSGTVDRVRLEFSESILGSSFTVADISGFVGPEGTVSVISVEQISGVVYDVTFAAQDVVGAYSLFVGPALEDIAGNEMDQNLNGFSGEPVADVYVAGFEVDRQFDFGRVSSPVGSGYTQITSADGYIASKGYGFLTGRAFGSTDRGVGTDVTRDYVSFFDAVFAVDVPDGSYEVTVSLGDPSSYLHDFMGVFLEGVQVDTVTTYAEVKTATYQVDVTDGQLTILFDDLGGSDSFVCVEEVVVRRLGAIPAGENALTAVAIDAAGNESLISVPLIVEVDATQPEIDLDQLLANSVSAVLLAAVDDDLSNTALDVAGQRVVGISVGEGHWAFEVGELLPVREGKYDVTITAENIAG